MSLQVEVGRPVSAHTVSIVINPDTQITNMHIMQGFHLRVGWNSVLGRGSYIGSYRYAAASEKAASHPTQPADEEGAMQRAPDSSPAPPEVWREINRDLDRYIDAWQKELREYLQRR